MKRSVNFSILLVSLLILTTISYAQAVDRKTPVEVQCGSVIEAELASNYEEYTYLIEMEPGSVLEVSNNHIGDQLSTALILFDPTGLLVTRSDGGGTLDVIKQPTINSGTLSARGQFTIQVRNYNSSVNTQGTPYGGTGGTGIYILNVRCTLRDGTVIEPGSAPVPTLEAVATESNVSNQPVAPNFSGFPGLPPVDFASAFISPLNFGTEITAQIPAAGNAILGYNFEGNEGDRLSLDFSRLSGNLNLGLVVLSDDNVVAFQASLITTDTLLTGVRLPSAGQYTIGIFRMDLVPVETPEPTSFLLAASLN